MNVAAMALALFALADLAILAHLRRVYRRRVKMQRMMTSLRIAVRVTNGCDPLPGDRRVLEGR